MSPHEDVEILSAYLDGEVSEPERARVEAHLGACRECAGRRSALEGAVQAVASLPEVAPTPDEARAIRLAVLGGAPAGAPARRPWGARLWAAAGAVGLLGAGIVGYAVLRSSGARQEAGLAARPPAALDSAAATEFASDDDVRTLLSSRPDVIDGVRRYRVADVGAGQAEAVASLATAAGPASGVEKDAAQTSRAAAPGAATTPPERPIGACLRQVLREWPYPTMPIAAEPAVYVGQEAWLLVFAWTPSTSDGNAPLDRVMVRLVSRTDCSTLNHSDFKP